MDPLLQFLIGGISAIVIAFGGFWFFGGFDPPRAKKPHDVPAE